MRLYRIAPGTKGVGIYYNADRSVRVTPLRGDREMVELSPMIWKEIANIEGWVYFQLKKEVTKDCRTIICYPADQITVSFTR